MTFCSKIVVKKKVWKPKASQCYFEWGSGVRLSKKPEVLPLKTGYFSSIQLGDDFS